jgi:hypothetical protein
VLPNGSPLYQGTDTPKALLESARGGDAIVTGLGLATGEVNPRAVALLWRAGERSLVDDIRIQWGYGSATDPYKKNDALRHLGLVGSPVPEHLGDGRRRRHLHRRLVAGRDMRRPAST